MACIWTCTRCAHNAVGDEPPERCPECQAPGEQFALWTVNDQFRQFAPDWTRTNWWEEGTGFRAGKIRPTS